jgi:hypothetical protein
MKCVRSGLARDGEMNTLSRFEVSEVCSKCLECAFVGNEVAEVRPSPPPHVFARCLRNDFGG